MLLSMISLQTAASSSIATIPLIAVGMVRNLVLAAWWRSRTLFLRRTRDAGERITEKLIAHMSTPGLLHCP